MYRRSPNDTQQWSRRANQDFILLGKVERILECDSDMLASLVRAAPADYEKFLGHLAGLVERHVAIVDAATEAHNRVQMLAKES